MNENRKYVVGSCPHCGASVVYSDDPKDKLTVNVIPVGDEYRGKRHLCAKCKKMYAVVDVPQLNPLSVRATVHI